MFFRVNFFNISIKIQANYQLQDFAEFMLDTKVGSFRFKDLMDNVIRQTFRNDNLKSLTNIEYKIHGIENLIIAVLLAQKIVSKYITIK